MADSDTSRASSSSSNLSRRHFLRGGIVAAAATGALGMAGTEAGASVRRAPVAPGMFRGNRPNVLLIMVDEMRYPPIYESDATRRFRAEYLKTQNALRRNGLDFQRHYAASVACAPSRASLFTGQYPSLHGVTQTTGAAKEAFDPDVFWLDPNTVPTFGDYFRAAGYQTYWKGKWHASSADLVVPGTHGPVPSYDTSGARDSARESLYLQADRLSGHGFSGWIGPEPHGSSALDSGSSVPAGQQGRDVVYAQQAKELLAQLARQPGGAPWFVVASFVNPHDITTYGLFTNLGLVSGFEFNIEEGVVPHELFDPLHFERTVHDDLRTKPSAQASYQESYAQWLQPILDDPITLNRYYRYYYQLHKNVDEQMMLVFQALLDTRFANDTLVIFTSDHGDLLGSHHGMHQKWHTAYDEAIRVPMVIWNPTLFPQPRAVETLTSHIDVVPTLLGLAGLSPTSLRAQLASSHSEAQPLVGRDLSPLVLGRVDPATIDDPLYFMTDDDVSRGLNQNNWTGVTVNSVSQPNHIETVIARLNGPGGPKIWKYTRYFDNPQFWSDPGDPPAVAVKDVVIEQVDPTPVLPGQHDHVRFQVTVKRHPLPEEFEMYNVTDDPMELENLYGHPFHAEEQAILSRLLAEERCAKRLVPTSGNVPGQPVCS